MLKKMIVALFLAVSINALTFNIAKIEGKRVTFETKQYHAVKMARELIREYKTKYQLRQIDRAEYNNRVNDVFSNMRNIGIYIN